MKVMLYILIGIVLLLIILYLTGRKSVHNEVIIHSKPEIVWNVIIDMKEYPNWNPVIRLLEGEVIEGNKVKYGLTQDEKKEIEIRATVVQLTEGKLLNQKGGNPLIFSFNYTYRLEKINESVKVTIHEEYSGIAVNFWNTKPIENAYERLNNALKERCENSSSIKTE